MPYIHDDEIAVIKSLPGIIKRFISQIPEQALDNRRNSDSWTIREHLYHIAGVQSMLLQRIKTIRNSERPVIEPYFPAEDVQGAKYCDMREALNVYADLREKQISVIRRCSEAELKREAFHKEYTAYNIPVILKHMIFHEYWHMYRVEELWLERDEYFDR
jgi:uncharacterized damage-inducible protein DinB